MSLRAVVTGGSGFLGSHLVEALQKRGFDVTILDSVEPRYPAARVFIKGSVTDRALVNRSTRGADVVFHLAGILGTSETIEMAYATADVNILGTLNVLDAAKEHGASVLYVTKPNFWRNPYTITKVAAAEFAFMYRDLFGMDVRVVRCYNVYGPRQRTETEGYQKAVPTFITKALRAEPLIIYGDGTQGTDHIYVSDAVGAMIAVFESDFRPQEAVDIGSGKEVSVNELARQVLRLTGSKSRINHVPMRLGEAEHTRIQADLSFLSKNIDFNPKIGLERGLEQTIAYYRQHMGK